MNPNEYDRMHALETEYWWFVGRRAIIDSLLTDLDERNATRSVGRKKDGLQLLDLGCGTGANLPMLQSHAGSLGHVTALDFSPLALAFAGRHPQSQGVSLVQGDALNLPLADSSFDLVTMFDVLEHLSDDRRALSEVRRVLRVGGSLVLSVPAYQHLWSAHDEALHHFRRYEKHDFSKLLKSAGFRVSRLSFGMSMMPPAAWLWRKAILPLKPRRPRDAKRHSEGAILPPLPPALNRLFIKYLEMEGRIIRHRPLRFGTSLIAVVTKL